MSWQETKGCWWRAWVQRDPRARAWSAMIPPQPGSPRNRLQGIMTRLGIEIKGCASFRVSEARPRIVTG